MIFGGLKRCSYPIQKFSSDSERAFASLLESDTIKNKWFKPTRDQFQITYRDTNGSTAMYEPDFVIETDSHKCNDPAQSLDKFAAWFLTVFGFGLTFLLTNYKNLEPLISVQQLKTAASYFVCAVAFGVAQRYLGAIISGIAAAARDGYELGKDFADLDWDEYVDAIRRALPFPLAFILCSRLRSLEKRQLLGSANVITWLTLIQSAMVLGQSVELLLVISTIFPKS